VRRAPLLPPARAAHAAARLEYGIRHGAFFFHLLNRNRDHGHELAIRSSTDRPVAVRQPSTTT